MLRILKDRGNIMRTPHIIFGFNISTHSQQELNDSGVSIK
jgi:hypothetical protein